MGGRFVGKDGRFTGTGGRFIVNLQSNGNATLVRIQLDSKLRSNRERRRNLGKQEEDHAKNQRSTEVEVLQSGCALLALQPQTFFPSQGRRPQL
jgi:hypothetical protein